jgi:hypothetical protein
VGGSTVNIAGLSGCALSQAFCDSFSAREDGFRFKLGVAPRLRLMAESPTASLPARLRLLLFTLNDLLLSSLLSLQGSGETPRDEDNDGATGLSPGLLPQPGLFAPAGAAAAPSFHPPQAPSSSSSPQGDCCMLLRGLLAGGATAAVVLAFSMGKCALGGATGRSILGGDAVSAVAHGEPQGSSMPHACRGIPGVERSERRRGREVA